MNGLPLGGYVWRGQNGPGGLVDLNARIIADRIASGEMTPPGVRGTGHGTEAGYQRHKRARQKACEACCEAQTAAHQRRAERRRAARSLGLAA